MALSKTQFAVGVLLSLVLIVGGILGIRLGDYAYSPLQPNSKEMIYLLVRKGESPQELTQALTSQKVIQDGARFIFLGRILRQWKKIKAGEYAVGPSLSPLEIFSTITSGTSVGHPVTIREGENFFEIAQDLEAKGLANRDRIESLCKDKKFVASLGLGEPVPPSLEGYLYPETYSFNRTQTPEDMLRQMVRTFNAHWKPEHSARASALGLSRHQIVTLASIVEKETGAKEERPLISSVFFNRMRKKMRLQSDPTTIYGIWERYDGNLHRSDLLSVNPYNTYMIPGLPIGPIGNPGQEALLAALNPAKSDYLYFVSHNDGTHEFTRTLIEHTQAVKKFQLNPKAREGKSWRDLKKNAY